MSLELVAVDGCILAHASGSLISGGAFAISSVPDVKAKAGGAGIFKGPLLFSFSGGSAAGFVAGSVMTTAPAVMNATAVKTKAGGMPVMREGDFVLMNCVGTLPPPTGGTAPVSGSVEIAMAGQMKAKAQ